MHFNGSSCSDLSITHVIADLIENHFQVTPSFRSLKNMSAQARVAFRVFKGGLRNAAPWELHDILLRFADVC